MFVEQLQIPASSLFVPLLSRSLILFSFYFTYAQHTSAQPFSTTVTRRPSCSSRTPSTASPIPRKISTTIQLLALTRNQPTRRGGKPWRCCKGVLGQKAIEGLRSANLTKYYYDEVRGYLNCSLFLYVYRRLRSTYRGDRPYIAIPTGCYCSLFNAQLEFILSSVLLYI